jgi:tetratricopeptide (TPR) repeat protein
MKTSKIADLENNAGVLFEQRNYDGAIDICRTINKLDPCNIHAFETKSASLLMLGRNEESISVCDDGIKINSIKINPKNLILLNTKGVALEHLNRYQEAIEIYDEILQVDPQNEQVRLNIEHAKESLGEYKKNHIVVTKSNKIITKSKSLSDEPMFASRGKRFLNLLIDGVAFSIMGAIIISLFDSGSQPTDNQRLLFLILNIGYYLLFEIIWQKTPGKWLTKTRVVMEDETKPDFAHILGRTMCRLIPFEVFSFLGKESVGWHDKISRTRVINAK